MAGNRNSGRKKISDTRVEVHFKMEQDLVDKLNNIAKEVTNNNRTTLIVETLKRLIQTYESR